ncbi:MAG: hypothetical protein US86_C0003G0004 [Candidatus Daviesbacteria bacterium GW2011_GWA2_38_24]|uniref:Shikimate kinase n=1 Tax=Candidatus Daviesbacteria bacterium GW2011_GWA2_38_24 TaxID=1618422 RepID=A0A0G0MPD8_9BACT|nr:MAG: hypothetical protein US86_C0003G0004 [Candidatus Daviesbacteria bacterium GW2011_GWA2_38_24]KKQ80424.1 MAG: hypothetical protein UT01_C0012G0004 [Candidatus Daviesbacteria bacterium GW2011_GWA1_38_7]OGE23878.1 MAG: hypothetical protein A2688_04190 [Candidatus Daviesbacteria bacterium RIFCSPHIGHO2_01_FULL_38_8]
MRIIILNGAVSSGKTTIGKLLIEKLIHEGKDAVFFDLDDLVEKRSPDFKWDFDENKSRDWLDARKELAELTNQHLHSKRIVVVVGPFFQKEEIEGFIKYVHPEAKIYLYTLTVPLEERLKRNRSRKYSNPDEDIAIQQKEINNLSESYGANINNIRSQLETVDDIVISVENNIGELQLAEDI